MDYQYKKYMPIVALKNFSLNRAVDFAGAIYDQAKKTGLLCKLNRVVVKEDNNQFYICSELSLEDEIRLCQTDDLLNDLDEYNYNFYDGYHYINLIAQYITNKTEEDIKSFELISNEKIEFLASKSQLAKFKKHSQILSIFENEEEDDDFDLSNFNLGMFAPFKNYFASLSVMDCILKNSDIYGDSLFKNSLCEKSDFIKIVLLNENKNQEEQLVK